MTKFSCEIPGPIENVYNYIKDNYYSSTMNPFVGESKIVQSYTGKSIYITYINN